MTRGAQPKNTNALKHGFYSRRFNSTESLDLQSITAVGLQDEILMLRVAIRRLFESSEEASDLKTLADAVNVLSMSADRLSSIMRNDQFLSGPQSSQFATDLSTALAATLEDLRK